MIFTKESQTVKNYALLINEGIKSVDEVPNLFNLRQVVAEVLGLEVKQ